MNFREQASVALGRAKAEMLRKDENSHIYAALELRMALESIVYEEAKQYKEELSEQQYNTWQPKKLLEFLLECDEFADSSFELLLARQESKGVVSNEFHSLGECRKLKLKTIKRYYDKLGNWLHQPTQLQLEKGNVSSKEKVYETCDELINIIGAVLSAPISKARLKSTTKIRCIKCENLIVRSIAKHKQEFRTDCYKCGASYEITPLENNKINWLALRETVRCANDGCDGSIKLFDVEKREGTNWICGACNKKNLFSLWHGIEE